jgi:membrane fusion protein, copper/silver efflux system
VRVKVPMAEIEPFRSLPADPPRLSVIEARRVYVCPDHPESPTTKPGSCPIDRKSLEFRPLSDYERLRWWWPMHPNVTADQGGASCKACGGMTLVPRVISYSPAGQVLCVPQSAVIDTGARKVVFVESMPGVFDGVEVVLGPRSGGFYPVVRGLEPGQRVAVAGAFLLDAETRLNPSLAAGYFGAGRGDHESARGPVTAIKVRDSATTTALDQLAPEDRLLADRQKLCPVTKKPLSSMGTPARIVVSGQVVFLCCNGCEDTLKRDPSKYLATLQHH